MYPKNLMNTNHKNQNNHIEIIVQTKAAKQSDSPTNQCFPDCFVPLNNVRGGVSTTNPARDDTLLTVCFSLRNRIAVKSMLFGLFVPLNDGRRRG
jgi:hypothetical protein